jgi:hypothetical protein
MVLEGSRDAEHLELIDRTGERTRRVPLGERLCGSETLALHFVDDVFVALFENGVIAIEPCGRERWRIGQVTYGWRLLSSDEGVLWLADAHDNVLAIDRATGEEAPV